jgi:hypothetical protein
MESKGYEVSDRSWVETLATLTYGILDRSSGSGDQKSVTAHVTPPSRRGFLDRVDTWFWDQELKSREAFLAQAVDIVDLEQRIRWLERGHH